MKGIITAGGAGTRLNPVTLALSKQLVPVYDKPMIYYPLATLMEAGVRDILIISTPLDLPQYERLLGDGSDYGLSLHYAVQQAPQGIAQAFHIGREFLAGGPASLILGDNVFYAHHLPAQTQEAARRNDGATIFGYKVRDPERYGVMEFDAAGNVISLEEKPENPKSHYAVVGLYFYDHRVTDIAAELRPSARGEYEITDVNKVYLERKKLQVGIMNRGTAWLDTGTFDSYADACEFVRVIEKRQSQKVGCIEEVAYRMGFIDKTQLLVLADKYAKSGYGEYLRQLKK